MEAKCQLPAPLWGYFPNQELTKKKEYVQKKGKPESGFVQAKLPF